MSGVVATMVAFAVLNRVWFSKEDSEIGLPTLVDFLVISFVSWFGFVLTIFIFISDTGIFSRKK
jgi:hypothetical protein